jgi:nucleotide-binding universal stress UspA family protein
MKILLAADGSAFTKKALAFLVTHESLCGPEDELVVFHAQPHLPPRVTAMVGGAIVDDYQKDEAEKVLAPIRTFLDRHPIRYRTDWKVGPSDVEILSAAEREKSHMIVMGTHGHGVIGRALMGSVAQRVITGAHVPVLLVK